MAGKTGTKDLLKMDLYGLLGIDSSATLKEVCTCMLLALKLSVLVQLS